MAERAHMPWIAVNVHTPRTDSLSDDAKDRIAEALRLAESLGGEAFTLHAESDVARELLTFARARNVTRILLGRPRRRRLSGWLREHVSRRLLSQSGQLEITIVAPEDEPAAGHLIQAGAPDLRPDLRAFGWATVAVALATAVSHVADRFLPLANLSLIFLMAVLLVAIRFGLWPSVYTSLLSFLVYNFFFTVPYQTFTVARQEDVLTIVFFLVVAVIVGNLAARLKAQVETMRQITQRTANLYDFSRRIAGAAALNDVLWAAVHHVASTLQCHALVLLPRTEERLEIASGYPPEDQMSPTAWGAANWAWKHNQAAGWSSGTLPASEWLFLPLKTGRGPLGLLGVSFENPTRPLTPEQRRLLEALIDQVAVAIERTNLATDIEEARLLTETERLRSALLSSVSHDLRTPLVSIIGSATGLVSCDGALSNADRAQLVQTILEESERLNRFVQNLLDMTRLGYGALQPNCEWVDLREIVGRAQKQMASPLASLKVEVRIPENVPILHVDPVLIEQVLVNILDNAAKILAGRRSDRDCSGAGGRASEGERERRGSRDPARGARRGVRRVLSRARRRQAGSRDGPGLVDLPRPDRGSRRPNRGAPRPGPARDDDRFLAARAAAAGDRRRQRRGRA
jgi:two-component system, OmpR family, sensor histidine kinase KdpD